MKFVIQDLDENTFLERTSDREQAIWFTPYPSEALVFENLEEAQTVAKTFNHLASRELQVQFSDQKS